MKRKRSEMGFDTEEFQRPAKRPRLDNDNHQPEVNPHPLEMFARTAFSYHTEYISREETGCGSTDTQADGQEKSHVIQPARETRPGPTDSQTSNYLQIQNGSKQETIEKSPVNLPAVETWFDSTDSKYLLSDQTANLEEGDETPSDTLDHLLSLINEYLYETTAVLSASSVLQKITEPVNDADLVRKATVTDEYSRWPTTGGLHTLPQTASSASAMMASVDGDRSRSLIVEHNLPSCSGSVIKSHSGTEQTTSTDSGLKSESGSIRLKKGVPRRRSSKESESKTEASLELASRTHFSEEDTTRKSASRKRSREKDASYESAPRKRSHEKDGSYESAPWKHSSEKSASHTSKQSSTKKAIQKRRFSRSKSPDNALERTQHKKAKCGTSSCEGQREKDKDSERSRHAQFVKNQGTSQAPQNVKNREIDSKDVHKMKYPSHLHEWLERVKFNHTRKWKMLHYEKPKWTPLQLALTSKSRSAGKA
ncbi:splicing regulatory glutamine/lysine-rich protein 1 isoform X2 [Magallana gigas]|uniref:splicing regulatory glutamine/lysine-rich protein 1 isoform X2 n=1 Tax=Magallana gigas TaxID=29159 RepID=UPI003341CD36